MATVTLAAASRSNVCTPHPTPPFPQIVAVGKSSDKTARSTSTVGFLHPSTPRFSVVQEVEQFDEEPKEVERKRDKEGRRRRENTATSAVSECAARGGRSETLRRTRLATCIYISYMYKWWNNRLFTCI